jgi:hypothetical protein
MGFPAADAKAKEGTDIRWLGRYLSAERDKLAKGK